MANGYNMETRKKNDKAFKLIVFLTIVILILALFIAYSFYLKPLADNYVQSKVDNARTDVVNTMLAQIQNQGFVRIIDGEGKEVILVPAQQ